VDQKLAVILENVSALKIIDFFPDDAITF